MWSSHSLNDETLNKKRCFFIAWSSHSLNDKTLDGKNFSS